MEFNSGFKGLNSHTEIYALDESQIIYCECQASKHNTYSHNAQHFIL